MKGVLIANPIFDLVVGLLDKEVPTKQDKFAYYDGSLFQSLNGEFKPVYERFYIKKEDKLKDFELEIRAFLENAKNDDMPYPLNQKVEVIVYISAKAKRITKEVDIDNLLKSVLDCLNGIVFKDDSQVYNIVGKKLIHPGDFIDQFGNKVKGGRNSIFIGIRKLNNLNDSIIKLPNLFFTRLEE